MKRRKGSGVPSQETVPHQNRYPVETAGNMMIDTNTTPAAQIHWEKDNDFPMPKPSPAGGSSIGYGSGAAFSTESHTDGKKR